jgi:hypothetical protein
MIQIDNLTPRQVEMLDEMWERESYEDYCAYLETLEPEDRKMAESLAQMVILAEMDNLVTENVQEAADVLKKFAL